jgi:hypothetical protein
MGPATKLYHELLSDIAEIYPSSQVIGKRLKHGRRWRLTRENRSAVLDEICEAVRSEGLPFLALIDSVEKLAHVMEYGQRSANVPVQWREDDANVIEARAYLVAPARKFP